MNRRLVHRALAALALVAVPLATWVVLERSRGGGHRARCEGFRLDVVEWQAIHPARLGTAEGLVACHVLVGRSRAAVRAALGAEDRSESVRQMRYQVNESSLLGLDDYRYLVLDFRSGRVAHASIGR